MNPYALSLAIGATGTAVMALRGLGLHAGHGGHAGHAGAHHGGHEIGGHHGGGHHGGGHHAGGHGGAHGGVHDGAHGDLSHAAHAAGHAAAKLDGSRLLSLLSPRVLFTFLVGVGATGLIASRVLVEPLLLGTALLGGVLFERFIVSPIWRFLFRFESSPALTLESAVMEEARAVIDFDRKGQGLISIDVDGQVIQLLGTLRPEDRGLGIRVKRGGRVRIEEVDPARNRCIVSYIGD
jgi:hypothetical protein